MVSPAVVEQQAKLGVSAEESKFERIKRQQARFRDRGGVFVPSTSNPLVDILLARTVSGESPSKAHRKDVTTKRVSTVKARLTLARKASAVTTSGESPAVVGSGKLPASTQKRKKKAPELEDDTTKKQRGGKQAKGKKKVPDTDLGTEQPPSDTKSKSTLKRKSKQRDTSTALSSSGSIGKPKPKTRAKSNSAKAAVDVPVSDNDRMLVDARSKIKSNIRQNLQNGDDGETDVEAPIFRKSALPPMDGMQTSGTKNVVRIKAEKIAGKGSSGKKIEDMCNGKVKGRANPNQDTSEPVKDDERPTERSSKPRKRKKEDDHDDQPQKAVKFSYTNPPHFSSRDLKENQSDKIHETIAKSGIKNDSDMPRSKLTAKLPSRAKRSKGPPREVLERIKASVGRHLHYADSDPDELDCLS